MYNDEERMIFMNTIIFAQRLREARTLSGTTQAKLSEKSGVTPATISAYENSNGEKGKNPSLDNAVKLAEALNVSLDWLCGLSSTNKRVKISDFVKQLISLSDKLPIEIDEILVEDCETSLPKAFKKISENPNEYSLKTKNNRHKISTITIADSDIQTFLKDWLKIKNLYINDTIDENLYNLWLEQQFRNMDLKQMELPVIPELLLSD